MWTQVEGLGSEKKQTTETHQLPNPPLLSPPIITITVTITVAVTITVTITVTTVTPLS